MTAKAAQVYVNHRIVRYGRLHLLKIDSKNKTMEFAGQLHGDDTPVAVHIHRYIVEDVGGKRFLSVADFSCSRPWLQNLLEDFIHGQRVELPPWAATAL